MVSSLETRRLLRRTDGHAEPPAKKQRTSDGFAAAPGRKLPGAIVLDIEGTVAAISFVTEARTPGSSGSHGRASACLNLTLHAHRLRMPLGHVACWLCDLIVVCTYT